MEFLKIENGKIVDSMGKPVYLRGACVGGWMNMEDFIDAYPGQESNLRKQMKLILGEKKGQLFFDKLLDNFLTEDDIKYIAGLGANCIRLPLNYRHFEDDMNPYVYKEDGFRRLDEVLKLCEKYNVYAVLDMHAVQGWQNSHWHSDNECGVSMFFTQKVFQDRLVALWEEFARRYEGKSVVAGYDLMNEPASNTPNGDHAFDFYENYHSDWDAVNGIYHRLVKAIRDIDSKHIIFLEGDRYSQLFSQLDAPFASNLAYQSHNYTAPGYGPGAYPGHYSSKEGDFYWDKNTHRRAFLNHEGALYAQKYNVPLWVGEFGSQYHGPAEQLPDRLRSMDDQIGVYNEFGIHWTTWTYKDAGIMGWVTLNPDSEYMQIVKPIQKMKKDLGAENFVAYYGEPCPGREKARALSDLILEVSGNCYLDSVSNAYSMNYSTLTGFAAATLQPSYAKRFQGMSESDIDRVMQSFHFKNCVVNKGFEKVLKKRLTEKY